jgi:hypothetical protein
VSHTGRYPTVQLSPPQSRVRRCWARLFKPVRVQCNRDADVLCVPLVPSALLGGYTLHKLWSSRARRPVRRLTSQVSQAVTSGHPLLAVRQNLVHQWLDCTSRVPPAAVPTPGPIPPAHDVRSPQSAPVHTAPVVGVPVVVGNPLPAYQPALPPGGGVRLSSLAYSMPLRCR